MNKAKLLSWAIALVAAAGFWFFSMRPTDVPGLPDFLFWLALLIIANTLPVALGFGAEVTMSFPLELAAAITFDPPVAMALAGIGAFDTRELRREIPLWHALFNRIQLTVAAGAASAVVRLNSGPTFEFPEGLVAIAAAAVVHLGLNLGLVGAGISLNRKLPVKQVYGMLVPRPAAGFWIAQSVLAGLGVATAAAYREIGAFVVAFLIPLMFARLSIIGARAQQELSEKVRRQQEALLEATERVFQEREDERHRIAEEIHDGSLQLLAAAAYGCSNAREFMGAGSFDRATETVSNARDAIDDAMRLLRESLVDLRRSSVEHGGLMETAHRFAEQASVLWGNDIRIEGSIAAEPPIPVALAAFQILQEGLTNALKHAQESSIVVRISDQDEMVHIVVEDEGPGFDPEQEVGADHVGMRLMKERAARVGGRIELDTAPGAGTRLKAILPGGVAQ